MKYIPILILLYYGCLASTETTTPTESSNTTASNTENTPESNNHTTNSEAIDINKLPCKSAEFAEETKDSVMDGKCVRSYYRVDQFGSIDVGE